MSGWLGGGTSAASSLRDLFSKWLRHEEKSCPREEAAENPLVVFLLWWSLLSGFAADKTTTNNDAERQDQTQAVVPSFSREIAGLQSQVRKR
ncbi:hypothetical protein [Saccharopolyspora gloriosae]|uniref:hypothetical protein n=1 Tax=Saccharopolyspora gloriosae TaxID=455344 RepID=UPI001C852B78|nr:hypothetical protein [Saccharopolyspora gloriosae]